MSIYRDKEIFLDECDYILKTEKMMIEEIYKDGSRGEYHAEKVIESIELLKTSMRGMKPEHINLLKREGGLIKIEGELDEIKERVDSQKKFYDEQRRAGKEAGEYGRRVLIAMDFCKEKIAHVETSVEKIKKILKALSTL